MAGCAPARLRSDASGRDRNRTLAGDGARRGVVGCDRQRADHRRRGLLPGVRVRACISRAATGTAMRMPGRAQRRARSSRCWPTRDATATFFTLGWIAERYPELVRRIAGAGPRAREPRLRPPARERADAEASSSPTSGSRRRSSRTLRACEVQRLPRAELFDRRLATCGRSTHRRSRLPLQLERLPDPPRSLRHARCAALRPRGACRACSRCPSRRCGCFSRNWPAGGGGYFRLLPYALSRWSIRRVNACDGQPAMFYFHPWELDPEQPRVAGAPRKSRFRHYLNLHRMGPRLTRLLRDSAGAASTACSSPGPRDGKRNSGRPRRRGRRFATPLASGDSPAATSAAGMRSSRAVRTRRSSTAPAGATFSSRCSAIVPITCSPSATARFAASAAGRGEEPAVRPCARVAAFLRLRRTGRCRRGSRERADRCSGGSRATLARRASRVAQPGSRSGRTGRGRISTSRSASRSPPDAEANMLAIPRKQRAMVRKGIEPRAAQRDRWRARPLLRAVRRQRASARHAAAAEALFRRADERVRR